MSDVTIFKFWFKHWAEIDFGDDTVDELSWEEMVEEYGEDNIKLAVNKEWISLYCGGGGEVTDLPPDFDEEDKDRASSSCDFKSLMTSSTVSRSKSGLALKSISHNLENTVIKTPGVVAIPSIARVHTFGNGPASSWPTPYNDSPACASKADLDCCPPVPRSPMSRFVSSPLAAAKEYKSFSDNSRMFSKSVFTASTSI